MTADLIATRWPPVTRIRVSLATSGNEALDEDYEIHVHQEIAAIYPDAEVRITTNLYPTSVSAYTADGGLDADVSERIGWMARVNWLATFQAREHANIEGTTEL